MNYLTSQPIRMAFAETLSSSKNLLHLCVIGPECTGKSTLSVMLANHYSTSWVPEYARAYLDKLNRPYEQTDLLKIAHGQIRLEEEWIRDAQRLVVFDTNLLVLKIWSEHKYGTCDPEIIRQHESRRYDHYFLTDIDIPWEDDPQREHPMLREHFGNVYNQIVRSSGIPYTLLSGTPHQRLEKAITVVDVLLSQHSSPNE